MTLRIDLNADLGEGCANDDALMEIISSCNIACGGHAGDAASMEHALRTAKRLDVAAGAHISFPDRENFGRVEMGLSGHALETELQQQTQVLMELAAAEGVAITHLKPHGALYNMAARSADLAKSIVAMMADLLPGAALVGPPSSEMETAAAEHGTPFRPEGFADRAYEADGQLRSRKQPGAVLHAPEEQVTQALAIVRDGMVITHDGEDLPLTVETLCVHGDTPTALDAARAIKAAFEAHGITIGAP